MPYLSRVWLNPRRAKARVYLSNPQVVHAAVLAAFPSPAGPRVLWRLEPDWQAASEVRHRVELLIVSEPRPSLTHIVEEAGFPGSDDGLAETADYQPLLGRLAEGQQYVFKVRVNPVQSVMEPLAPSASQRRALESAAGRHRGFRVPHRTLAHQTGWLIERAGRWGLEIAGSSQAGALDLRECNRERLDFRKSARTGPGRRVQIATVTFEGRARVVNAHLLRDALLNGVGPAKAYGCGLLTLAPLPTDEELRRP